MSEDRRRADADAGKRAQVLRDELGDILAEIERDTIGSWKASDPRDEEGRALAWSLVRAIELLKSRIQRRIDNGRIAEHEVALLNAKD